MFCVFSYFTLPVIALSPPFLMTLFIWFYCPSKPSAPTVFSVFYYLFLVLFLCEFVIVVPCVLSIYSVFQCFPVFLCVFGVACFPVTVCFPGFDLCLPLHPVILVFFCIKSFSLHCTSSASESASGSFGTKVTAIVWIKSLFFRYYGNTFTVCVQLFS